MRESYRVWVFSRVSLPLAKIVSHELSKKLNEKISLNFDDLAAADTQGRARAFKSLIDGGMKEESRRYDLRLRGGIEMSNERSFPAKRRTRRRSCREISASRRFRDIRPGTFDEATDPADVYKAFFSDVGNTDLELEFTAAIEIENPGEATERSFFVFDLDTSAEGWQPRPYHFRIEGAWTRDGTRRTLSFARGIVQID